MDRLSEYGLVLRIWIKGNRIQKRGYRKYFSKDSKQDWIMQLFKGYINE